MKILFEVWGNYKNWREVNYIFNGKKQRSYTTLPLLNQELKPDKLFVIVSDTLINNFWQTSHSDQKEYCDYLKEIKKDIISFSKDILKEDDIIIVPGVGKFDKAEFNGNPNNFFYIVYYEISKRIISYLNNQNELSNIEVYLDITHGINYMTVMTYRAIKDIFSIISFFYSKVKYVVLNSDPVVGTENIEVNVNEIENIFLVPQFSFYKFNNYQKILQPSKYINNNQKEVIGKDINKKIKEIIAKNYLDECLCFAASFQHALLPFIYYFLADIGILKNLLDNVINIFNSKLLFNSCGSNKISVVQQVNILPLFQSLLQTFLIVNLIVKKCKVERENEIEIKEFEENLIKLYNYNPPLKTRINKELDKIKNIPNINNYYKDYGFYTIENYENTNKIDDRNLYAHSGFAYTIIQLKKGNGNIFIKIKEPKDKILDEVKSIILRNIPKGD